MEQDKPVLEKRARRYLEEGGFIEGDLILTRVYLLFKTNSKVYTQRTLLQDITGLTIYTNPEVRKEPSKNGVINFILSGGLYGITATPKLLGQFICVKSKTKDGIKSTGWYKLYENPQPTYNIIHQTIRSQRRTGSK